MSYLIKKTAKPIDLHLPWHDSIWENADTLAIKNFHVQSCEHRPTTLTRLLHDDDYLYVYFQVQDQYVKSVATQLNDSVCKDSCVEMFIEPIAGQGYFNFEINCSGTLLLSHVTDPTRTKNGLAKCKMVTAEQAKQIKIVSIMPKTVDPMIEPPMTWTIAFSVPFTFFEAFLNQPVTQNNITWRANFYKCGSPKAHWASWSPIGDLLNFHVPKYFASITLQ